MCRIVLGKSRRYCRQKLLRQVENRWVMQEGDKGAKGTNNLRCLLPVHARASTTALRRLMGSLVAIRRQLSTKMFLRK